MLRRLIAVVGPTASGKSSIALELARDLGGEIVNGDSRQVYRGMDVGTAKPSVADRRSVRHHLFDAIDPRDGYSLGLYQRHARAALDDIWSRGSFAWLVGGTGQYIWSLLENWTVPEVAPDEDLRAELNAIAQTQGAVALHDRLRAVDPVSAGRIDARNVRRVVRAIEVFERTGVAISTWQTRGKPDFEYLLYGIEVDPAELRARIEQRVDAMLAAGFIDEVRALIASGVSAELPAMSSIGYREISEYLSGDITTDEARQRIIHGTRQLARRQRQWFRRDDARIHWVRAASDIALEANIFTGACTNVIRGENR
jgi:tRNA dimethylallyltransferase